MVVIALILLSLGVALFIMLSDTRRNDNFKKLEQAARNQAAASTASSDAGHDAGGDHGSGGD